MLKVFSSDLGKKSCQSKTLCSFVFLFLMFFGINSAFAANLPSGGSGFSSAPAIQPGTYQGPGMVEGQDLYYVIHAAAGQQIKLIDNISPAEPLYGVTHEITLYDENQNQLMNDNNSDNTFTVYWLSGAEKSVHNYYLKISDVTWDTTSFALTYSLINYYDAGSQTDAGESFDKAISLGIGDYKGYVSGHPYLALQVGDDQKDYYKISVNKGVTYEFKATPEAKGFLLLEMFNSSRELLDEKTSANEGAITSLSITPSANTNIYLALSDAYTVGNDAPGNILDYSLNVKSSSTALTKFYNCENGGCELAGSFASLTDCQATTAKVCYQTSNCDNKCAGGGETFTCVANADCPSGLKCASGQCVVGGIPPVGGCEDECGSGQTKCFDNFNYYKCGDYNKDGCYEWASPVYCGEGNKCSNGSCAKADGCQCSEWQSSGCGISGCPKGQMAKTRTCVPAACDIEKMCQDDDSCGNIILPFDFNWFGFLGNLGVLAWFSGFFIIFWILAYAYFALCLQVIAKKTGTPNEWMAWIPIANIFLMVNVAKKPLWWILLLLIPLVNIVIAILLWMAIAEQRGKENWIGILIIVPVVGIAVPGYLAFFDNNKLSKEKPNEPYAPTGNQAADKPTVGYKHACKYCDKLIPPNSSTCPFCEKINPLGPNRCPKCHEPVEKGWKVCAKCNQSLRIVCPFCGKVTFFGDHCEDCGKRLLVTCPNCGQEQPPIGDNCIKCNKPLKEK